MNEPQDTAPWEFEFETLMKRLLDGRLDAAEQSRLNTLLAENPPAMDAYVQLMRLDTLLHYRHAPPGDASPALILEEGSVISPSPLMGEGRGEGFSSVSASPPSAPSLQPSATQSPVLGFLGGVVNYVTNSRTLLFWLMFGSLGLYFAVQFGSLLLSRFWAQNAAQLADDRGPIERLPQARGNGNPRELVPGDRGEIVARLTAATDCQWTLAGVGASGRGSKPFVLEAGAVIPVGQKLNLLTGLAEITFRSGATVILHARSQFAVTSDLEADLEWGKLTARAPHDSAGHGAAGFTIATPAGKVVDLGTEFGVRVNDDRTMHVVVYVGEVQVESAGGSAGAAGRPVVVKAGEAILVAPGQPVRPLVAYDERFVRDLSQLDERASTEAAYVEYVKSLKPAVWFRMEGAAAERVLHDEAGGRDAKLYWDGPGNPFVKGPVGKSLWLRGSKLKDYAETATYPQASHGKLSVAAWVYAESLPADAAIVANWNSDSSKAPGGQFYFGLGSANDRNLTVMFTDAGKETSWLVEDLPQGFPLYQWQHVAFTTDGTTMRLYRQGREVAQAKHSGLLSPSPVRALSLGARSTDRGNPQAAKDLCWWDGKIDEVTVFNEELSPEAVRKLAGARGR